MLKGVVSINETWIRSFEPELNRQSSEWHTPATSEISPKSEQTKSVDDICV